MGVKIHVPVDIESFLPHRIRRLAGVISSPRLIPMSNGKSMRGREWRVLLVVGAYGPLTIKEAAVHAVMDAATTSRAVQVLLSEDLIAVRTHRGDRRKQVITLTQPGATVHDELARRRLAFSDELLTALTKTEQRDLFVLLDKLEQHVADSNEQKQNPFFDY